MQQQNDNSNVTSTRNQIASRIYFAIISQLRNEGIDSGDICLDVFCEIVSYCSYYYPFVGEYQPLRSHSTTMQVIRRANRRRSLYDLMRFANHSTYARRNRRNIMGLIDDNIFVTGLVESQTLITNYASFIGELIYNRDNYDISRYEMDSELDGLFTLIDELELAVGYYQGEENDLIAGLCFRRFRRSNGWSNIHTDNFDFNREIVMAGDGLDIETYTIISMAYRFTIHINDITDTMSASDIINDVYEDYESEESGYEPSDSDM